ncbi:MAG: hypothetical protein JNM54_04380 [Candidatus Accumulibacter sp.]|jgi:hypothetical protein|uniref:hypothetical protein n=1 Tax=unclassified Candidatus Accumulibacter TaxID=2619054 RepID=UPI0005BA3476|nr:MULTISPECIES: hypothetical protein [unclassified Candidatus Accumulibacter]MQM33092.1 hypothetical protein [Candidatus Accumulibacter phosphatis]MBL8367144.1 hypothetical protein [Accumulibacter sp.]MBN8514825.1 hypothetical protein [Accumulibacter sp.]MBO3701674.1 hypothetical protein [Accumulibacter sp.]HRE70523.1 hypothetical protein [Accumulibacter sp.]
MVSTEKHWLVRPETIKLLWRVFIAVLALTVAAELVVHLHPHFGFDGWFGFHAWYGFLTCAAMIVFAKGLGLLIKRPDTYYGEDR